MFTDEEQFKIKYLCEEVPELSHIIRRYKEESQYILTSVSHELRNPITLIHSTVQLMERRNPSVAQIPYWSQLKDDINTTISLLNEYSDFNHSENVHWSTIDLYQLIHDVKCSFMTTCNDKDIKLTLDISDISKEHIASYSCDPVKIKQVLSNIIRNAIEAIDDNGLINIDVNANPARLCQNINGTTYMTITISNNGRKIDEDELPNIFEPFITYKTYGTGLGLAISNRIINSHGGRIQAYSEEDLTSFIISLPLL